MESVKSGIAKGGRSIFLAPIAAIKLHLDLGESLESKEPKGTIEISVTSNMTNPQSF